MNLGITTLRCAIAVLAFSLNPLDAQDLNATVSARAGDFAEPLDAAPSPDGSLFYFTAIGPNGPGVFRVASSGGPVTAVFTGAPFVAPIGLTVSGDGRQIFVADRAAWAGGGRVGQIFVVPATGGTPRALRGAEGRGSRGIEAVSQGGQDTLYFSGYDPEDRTPAVYQLAATGADAATVIYQGSPLTDPDGIAIDRSGRVYVTDHGVTAFTGSVFRIEEGVISKVVETMRAGNPAGIALSQDEATLLVSTRQPYRDRAQVLLVDLSTLDTSTVTRTVGQISDAGGLHRARNVEIYSWCGAPMGPVFKIMKGGAGN